MEYYLDAGARGIALDHKLLIEGRELKKQDRGECVLQSPERAVGVVVSLKRLLAQDSCQWRGDRAEAFDEPMIVARQLKECPDRARRVGRQLVLDGLNFLRVDLDAVCRNHMPEVGHHALAERTLRLLDEEAVLLQLGEDEVDVAKMLRPCPAVYQDIVKENKHEPVKTQVQDVVHKSLKCCRRVRQSEGHDEELEQPFVPAERCLLHVGVMHLHLMVPEAQVKLGQEDCTPAFVDEFFDHRNRVLTLDGLAVQGAIADAHAP
jgi:hypothetical protein